MYRSTVIFVVVFFTASVFGTASANVNDSTVKKWIATGDLGLTCDAATSEADLDAVIAPNIIAGSWKYLKDCRDGGRSQDLNLAAAEWYLFIRYAASSTGDTWYKSMPGWYNTLKGFTSVLALSEYIQTSDQPVSKTNPKVKAWGDTGVEHGLRDYENRTGEKPSMKTSAFITGWEFVKGNYF